MQQRDVGKRRFPEREGQLPFLVFTEVEVSGVEDGEAVAQRGRMETLKKIIVWLKVTYNSLVLHSLCLDHSPCLE